VRFAAVTSAALLLAPTLAAQLADLQPGRNFTAEPNFGADYAENIDCGDVDLDGDLDVLVANGGKPQAVQLNRLYINSGAGTFSDETATRLAGIPPGHSRDVEFTDLDDDGDLDAFTANNASGLLIGEVSRFYVNLGGLQRGNIGYFAEDTDNRWGTLVAVPADQQVCGGCNSGPFRDWSCDCDFGDLDDDGAIDLFFGSYGPTVDGSKRSRLFLNDGLGVFNELWPWATTASDTMLHLMDVDLADFDGDFDLDVFAASRNSQSRVYMNNRYAPVSAYPFNDITQVALLDTGAVQVGQSCYEVEYGDLDGDADLDVWLINYNGNTDRVLRNDGIVTNHFEFTQVNQWIKNDPSSDEVEADFGDYDNDGDLDAFVANFSGTNHLYQSAKAQGYDPDVQGLFHRCGVSSGQSPNPELPSNFNGGTSSDGEWADLDGDGDLDILLANQGGQQNYLFRNILGVPDTHAPTFAQVTSQADKPNGSETVIHAQVRDNAPFTLFISYQADLVYTVDGGPPQSVGMLGQWGQQFRGVIPAQSDATVEYHVEVTDFAGNTGVSDVFGFLQGGGDAWTDLGSGLAGTSGVPSLVGAGPLTAGSTGTLTLAGAAPSAVCALFVSIASAPAPFKCGTLVPVPVAIQLTLATNGSGILPLAWGAWPSGLSGASLYFQYAIADGAAVCGTALSNALRADVP
jgi:hypothetical protein